MLAAKYQLTPAPQVVDLCCFFRTELNATKGTTMFQIWICAAKCKLTNYKLGLSIGDSALWLHRLVYPIQSHVIPLLLLMVLHLPDQHCTEDNVCGWSTRN